MADYGYKPHIVGIGKTRSEWVNNNGWLDQSFNLLPQDAAPGSVPVWDGSKWVAKSPAPKPKILRPFVLKCPSCMAPVEASSDVGSVTTCEYCHVPLVWEPIESLGRDDQGYRIKEPERQEGFDDGSNLVMAFPKFVMGGNTTRTFQIQPNLP